MIKQNCADRMRLQIGRRLRLTIDITHDSMAVWAREFEVSHHKLGNWLRGDNFPDPVILVEYCSSNCLTMDWFYRGITTGLPRRLAKRLEQQQIASGWHG